MPSRTTPGNSGKWLFRGVLLALLVAPFIAYPPLRLPSRQASGVSTAAASAAAFNARDFSSKFWTEKLQAKLQTALKVEELHAALEAGPDKAAKKHARLVGIGGTAYYFVQGEGTVGAADADGVTLSLAGATGANVILDAGLVFGNAVRDGTGLLDANGFANSEEFNAVAAELNTLVENTVLPGLRKLGVAGTRLHFVGVAEITDLTTDPRPLHLIPLKVEARP